VTAARFLAEPAALAGEVIHLDGPEGRHAAAVRRLRPGERIDLTDGHGQVVCGTVTAVGPDWVDVRAESRVAVPAPTPWLVVVQALVKADAGERAVASMVEVGVDEIVPWPAARSVVRWEGVRGEKSLQRWRATAREAAKQSRRAWLPVVGDPCTPGTLTTRVRNAALAVVLHESATAPLAAQRLPTAGDLLLIVGPEGGIAPEEIDQLAAAGAQVCRLGPTVLRTSTAATAAAAVVLAGCGRWG
jgi:16S rRNA (uracil1498-N3)-methyltransferase